MSAHQITRQGGFVLRFERGSRHDQHLAGHFLGWQGGYFTPCNNSRQATTYKESCIAREVAIRAEQAYHGARFAIVPAIQ